MIISSGITGLKDKNGKKISFYQSMEDSGIDRIKDVSPSTLHFISYLEKCGHEIKYSIFARDLEEQLSYFNPDVVALSGCSPDMDAIFKRAKDIKTSYPDIVVVVGGYMANNIGDLLIHNPDIDAVFEGESEYSFPLFLKNLQKEKITKNLENIALGKSPITPYSAKKILSSSFARLINGETIYVPINNVFLKDSNGMIYFNHEKNKTGTATDIAPIQGELDDILDIPWWGIYAENSPGLGFDMFGSSRSGLQWQGVGMYARRGCSGKCTFCSIKCGLRTPSVDSVVDKVNKTITEYSHQTPKRKASSIHFTDDSFTQNLEWCKSLLKKLRETRLSSRLEMSMQHRVDDLYAYGKLDTETLDLLAENNFRQNIGVESMSPRTIEDMKKASDGTRYIKQAEELILESLKR